MVYAKFDVSVVFFTYFCQYIDFISSSDVLANSRVSVASDNNESGLGIVFYTGKYNKTNDDPTANNEPKTRVKRQSGAGKYAEASRMSQMKVFRLFLQLFKNMWASSYIGGAHPMHHEVPKPFVKLLKDKVIAFFFPEVGNEKVDTK